MIRNRPGTTAGVAVAALGAGYYYYLQRTGGDLNAAAREMKKDANMARGRAPRGDAAEKAGEKTGLEGAVEEAVSNPRAAGKPDERIPEDTTDGKTRIGEMRDDAAHRFNTGVNKMDRTVEQKASETKGGVTKWFSK
ncbi:hypothetical protein PHISP_08237 [Aspergillus sp. HF37]|nr:hypothetical protein PHISP_08237 [Aspergillus sp. HF37]